jgi:hypothetical protein
LVGWGGGVGVVVGDRLKAADADMGYSALDAKLQSMWKAAAGTPERTRLEREHQEAADAAEVPPLPRDRRGADGWGVRGG